jgi:hypothetical protein
MMFSLISAFPNFVTSYDGICVSVYKHGVFHGGSLFQRWSPIDYGYGSRKDILNNRE